MKQKNTPITPFLKWAGGKRQLLPAIEQHLPDFIRNHSPYTFIEPFVGGGAVFLYLLQRYPNAQKVVINDTNPALINAYQIIQKKVKPLIRLLHSLSESFFQLQSEPQQLDFFLEQRRLFNLAPNEPSTEQAARLIFLNRTCFNGLYRVNQAGKFNVPFGKYKRPKILNEENLLQLNLILKNINITLGDFENCSQLLDNQSFIYLDPPYKPVTRTASFTSYTGDSFDDDDQHRLKDFCDLLTRQQAWWLMSNSAPENGFFEQLYADYRIEKVTASRNINSVGSKRGAVAELLIANY